MIPDALAERATRQYYTFREVSGKSEYICLTGFLAALELVAAETRREAIESCAAALDELAWDANKEAVHGTNKDYQMVHDLRCNALMMAAREIRKLLPATNGEGREAKDMESGHQHANGAFNVATCRICKERYQ